MTTLSQAQAEDFVTLQRHAAASSGGSSFADRVPLHKLVGGPSLVLAVECDNAIARGRQLVGSSSSAAKSSSSSSSSSSSGRNSYGLQFGGLGMGMGGSTSRGQRNESLNVEFGAHAASASRSAAAAAKELPFFFGELMGADQITSVEAEPEAEARVEAAMNGDSERRDDSIEQRFKEMSAATAKVLHDARASASLAGELSHTATTATAEGEETKGGDAAYPLVDAFLRRNAASLPPPPSSVPPSPFSQIEDTADEVKDEVKRGMEQQKEEEDDDDGGVYESKHGEVAFAAPPSDAEAELDELD